MSVYEFKVTVKTEYLEKQSEPERSHYVFAYTVRVTNNSAKPVQLIARHWVITDNLNHTEEVRGLGVVGHQPLLNPGEHFEYTSGCVLRTPQGSMRGEYFCMTEDGEPRQQNPDFIENNQRHG